MESKSLLPVLGIENGWARLSTNPDYQRSVTKFFKAPGFYVRCDGLFAGSCRASGRRAVYCDRSCGERLNQELATLVGVMLPEAQPTPPPLPPAEDVEDVQVLKLQTEEDVKALFRDFKRAARNLRLGRQLEAALGLLQCARRWTAPLRWPAPAGARFQDPPPGTPQKPASSSTCGDTPETTTSPATPGQLRPDGPAAVAAAAATALVQPGCEGGGSGVGEDGESGGSGSEWAPGDGDCTPVGAPAEAGEGAGKQNLLAAVTAAAAAAVGSHPLPEAVCWAAVAEGEEPCGASGGGSGGSDGRRCGACSAEVLGGAVGGGAYSAAVTGNAAAAAVGPSLRALRTTAPPVTQQQQEQQQPLATFARNRLLADAASCDSDYSSLTPSAAATPAWGPATPRFMPAAAAATTGGGGGGDSALTDTNTGTGGDPLCRESPAPGGSGGTVTVSPPIPGGPGGGGGGGVRCSGGEDGVLVVCCCVDLEWWERDASKVTEIGWTLWDNLTRRLESRHHIVAEHEALVNRIYVPDHKHDFLFGASSFGSLADGAAALQRDLDGYGRRVWAEHGPAYLRQQGQLQEHQGEPQQQGQPRGQQQGEQQPQQEQEQPQQQQEARQGAMSQPAAEQGRMMEGWQGCPQSCQRAANPGTSAAGGGCVVTGSGSEGGQEAALCGGSRAVDTPDPTSTSTSSSAAAAAAALLDPATEPRVQVVLVGHGLSQDLKALSGLLGVVLPPGTAILDTADLAWAVLGGGVGHERNTMSLRLMLKTLDIAATKLHNGGNDARYTMEAMLALATMEPLCSERQSHGAA